MKEIFIHREDLPESCLECPFMDSSSDFPNMFCNVTSELCDSYKVDVTEERNENCPIKIVEDLQGAGK